MLKTVLNMKRMGVLNGEKLFKTVKNDDSLVIRENKRATQFQRVRAVKWIDQWKKVKGLDFSLDHKHFFLEGRHLDDIAKESISNAKTEVLVVNPYVNHCDLSNTLREASKSGVDVKLITRPPDIRQKPFRRDKQEYHKFLKEDGVNLTYNKAAHAKIIAVDRAVAIVSSMNFYGGSSSGASWETGLVSVEETVVESIVDSILELLEKPESIEMA